MKKAIRLDGSSVMANFYKCNECGEIVLEMASAANKCPNTSKTLLNANSTDAAQEKHVPVVSVENGMVKVQVGSNPHPMLPEHYIQWIYVKTSFGGIYCNLAAGDPPEALLNIKPEEVEEVYEYCNLHGLWKAPIPALHIESNAPEAACSAEFSCGCTEE